MSTPQHHRLAVPDQKTLRIGTLNAILRQVAAMKGVSREDILATLSSSEAYCLCWKANCAACSEHR